MHRFFAVFFGFGACMCLLTILLLFFPGTPLDSLWRLNPTARLGFQSLGIATAIVFMLVIGIACASAATGLWRGTSFGRRLAVIILSFNILGDLLNACVRHDYRALIGLPVGGAMVVYLLRAKTSTSE
jgi:hypothetical protein